MAPVARVPPGGGTTGLTIGNNYHVCPASPGLTSASLHRNHITTYLSSIKSLIYDPYM